MRINEVEIKNFYSMREASVVFDDYEGLVLIEGQNKDTGASNGAGKSIIIEAVVWGLFGQTIRKSTEEALVNNQKRKECTVRIRVNENIVIERGKRPTTLHVFQDGEDITRANQRETQAMLEELLETNYKVFLASTVFGQQNTLEFLGATPDEKRTILKSFLNLDHLFDLRESVKYLKSQYSQRIKAIDAIVQEHEKSIAKFEKDIAHSKEVTNALVEKYSHEVLEMSPEDVAVMEAHNQDIEWQIVKKKRRLDELERAGKDLIKKIERAEQDTCYACGQELQEKPNTDQMYSDLASLKLEIATLDDEITELPMGRKDIPITTRELTTLVEYKSLRREQETFQEIQREAKEKIDELLTEKSQLHTNYEIMRFWEKAFSEQGLVKYIVRNILVFLNDKVNYYLSHLAQGRFSLEFDQELRETITNQGREVSYISLSGGERRKVNLAVMLGLQSLLTISSNSDNNLLFFDEVAENIDQEGIDGLHTLLVELKKTKTLFVITHNNYLKSCLDNASVLPIIKHKGVSTIRRNKKK